MAWRRPRVIAGVVLAVALMLILVDTRVPAPGNALRGVASAVAGPPERAVAWARTKVTDRFGGSAADRARIAELEQQLEAARAQVGVAASDRITRGELRDLAAQAPASGYSSAAARVVSVTARQDPVRSAAISVGSGQGVRPGFAVLAPGGIVGLVDTVSPNLATVRLMIDPQTQIAARVASSGELGIVRGTGSAAAFEPLDPLAPLTPGSLVVTMGVPGGQYPADLPIGRVTAITGSSAALTRAAELAMAVDDSTLDRVLALVPDTADGARP